MVFVYRDFGYKNGCSEGYIELRIQSNNTMCLEILCMEQCIHNGNLYEHFVPKTITIDYNIKNEFEILRRLERSRDRSEIEISRRLERSEDLREIYNRIKTVLDDITNKYFTPLRIKNAQISHLYSVKTAHYVGVLNEKMCNKDYKDFIVKENHEEIDNPQHWNLNIHENSYKSIWMDFTRENIKNLTVYHID